MCLLIPGLVQHSRATRVFIGQAGEDSKHDVTWSWRNLGLAMDHHISVSPSAMVPCYLKEGRALVPTHLYV